ncbi:hypothetical protein BKA67DRAFT_320297 [Truncatella angustata]|uniref:Uncharacterized protein n=1 Tax=Truncatella angustata TaxID=152316 RepID=A0A9P8UJN7_9PEZI|nr:uncharacterized protein BKA67DRAFT_320297 [Truncatella angustata]KAH6653411.1 hypothetical protein BKA67DRAFT_320297 [Truncatella angustata]
MARHHRLLPFDGPLQAYVDHLEDILLSLYGSTDQVRQWVLSRVDVVATSAPEILAQTWATDNAMRQDKPLTAPRTAGTTSRPIMTGLEISGIPPSTQRHDPAMEDCPQTSSAIQICQPTGLATPSGDVTNSSIIQPPTLVQTTQVAIPIQGTGYVKLKIAGWQKTFEDFLARVPENEQEWLQLEASSGLNCSGHIIDIFHRVTRAQDQIQVTSQKAIPSKDLPGTEFLLKFSSYVGNLKAEAVSKRQQARFSEYLLHGHCIVARKSGMTVDEVNEMTSKALGSGDKPDENARRWQSYRTAAKWFDWLIGKLEGVLKHRAGKLFLLCK